MSFYYTREYGDEGQILVGDGDPPGEALSRVLSRGPLGVRTALEIIAYLADVLTIAEEDEEVHGDLKPGFVFIDSSGSVHVSGFGEARRGGRAPEGRPVGQATDIYGVGLVLVSLLTSDSIGAIPRAPEAHDDLIIEKLKQIDWQDLADRSWQEQVLHFLCSMLSHAPGDRPEPLDVANVLGYVAQQLGGESLETWASREFGLSELPLPTQEDSTEEDLSGAHRIGDGQLMAENRASRKAASTKGESTAFWTREKIEEMLRESEVEDEAPSYAPPEEEPVVAEPTLGLPPEIPELPDATIGPGSNTLDALKEARSEAREASSTENALSDSIDRSDDRLPPSVPAPESESSLAESAPLVEAAAPVAEVGAVAGRWLCRRRVTARLCASVAARRRGPRSWPRARAGAASVLSLASAGSEMLWQGCNARCWISGPAARRAGNPGRWTKDCCEVRASRPQRRLRATARWVAEARFCDY